MDLIRILLIADTHLGFDLPFHRTALSNSRYTARSQKKAMAVFSAPAFRVLAPDIMNSDATLVEHADYRQRQK